MRGGTMGEEQRAAPGILTLVVDIRVAPASREELVAALHVLFDELSRETTFVDAVVHTSVDEHDLIVVIERWRETKESFLRDRLKHPSYGPYRKAFERFGGISRTARWLESRGSWGFE